MQISFGTSFGVSQNVCVMLFRCQVILAACYQMGVAFLKVWVPFSGLKIPKIVKRHTAICSTWFTDHFSQGRDKNCCLFSECACKWNHGIGGMELLGEGSSTVACWSIPCFSNTADTTNYNEPSASEAHQTFVASVIVRNVCAVKWKMRKCQNKNNKKLKIVDFVTVKYRNEHIRFFKNTWRWRGFSVWEDLLNLSCYLAGWGFPWGAVVHFVPFRLVCNSRG